MQLVRFIRVALPIISLSLAAVIMFGNAPFAYAAPGDQRVYYYLHDHLGGISAVTDEQGNVVEWRDYLPYGADRLEEDDAPAGADVTNYGFTGKEQDPETELYYYGARYYDPRLGRFISPDPWEGDLANPQTLNKYSYALNNPLFYVDPTGLINVSTGEAEKGDNLTSIAQEYNGIFGTNITYQDLMKINPGIQDANKINVGDAILMGTIGENGEIWSAADSNNFNADFRAGLNDLQSTILHYQRNYYQRDLPQTINDINWGEWEDLGEAVAHNIGTSGNRDLRGTGSRAGQQAIYDTDGNLVTSPENRGTFDFVSPRDNLAGHQTADVNPWIRLGNSPADTTTPEQRGNALQRGIIRKYFIDPVIPTAQ